VKGARFVYVQLRNTASLPLSASLQSEFSKNLDWSKTMSTTYLIWQDPSCKGINPQWDVLSRDEFLVFLKSPEADNRRFIKLGSTNEDGSDGRIVIEATEIQYKDWLVEKRRTQYLRERNSEYKVTSYHAYESEDDDDSYGEEILKDWSCDVEIECFKMSDIETLREAITELSDEENRLITYLYLSDNEATERGYSAIAGIPLMTVNDRKHRILKKIRKKYK
jgi:hypothetical protein